MAYADGALHCAACGRFTWDIIRRARPGRAIVLTTHSMEEADLLADDIAIMAAGRLVAQGSPLELKARYGVGYTLTLVKGGGPDRRARLMHTNLLDISVASSMKLGSSPAKMHKFVSNFILIRLVSCPCVFPGLLLGCRFLACFGLTQLSFSSTL